MQPFPDPSYLLEHLELSCPLIGIYDASPDTPFPGIVEPPEHQRQCIFAHFDDWVHGQTLKLTADRFGCGGCGRAWFGVQTRSRDEFLNFLTHTEGLKDDKGKMADWVDSMPDYRPEHGALFMGLLYREYYAYLKSVLFFVNPDQLSILAAGVQYHAGIEDPPPLIASFGSGCMQSLVVFKDLSLPQAAIGATDLAMRQYFPPDILVVTATVSMYERLCRLDSQSFLGKGFLKSLKKARHGF